MQIDITQVQKSNIDNYDFNNLEFGKIFTDYMLVTDYDGKEWSKFSIEPIKHLTIHPAMSALHYGQTVFEGLKAYRNEKGEVNIFRLTDNLVRLNKSAERMEMAQINVDDTFKALSKFIEMQKEWIPARDQGSLYIRPFIIATDNTLRAKPSSSFRFMVIACPVGFYYSKALSIVLGREYTRAASGGVGFAKAGGNYAASFYPNQIANELGYDQILWTDINHDYTLEELGSANFFYVRDNELITPQLKDSILAGITRDTVITIARERGLVVREELIKAGDFEKDLKAGRVNCMFATGTAASMTFVNYVTIDGSKYHIKSDKYEPMDQIKNEIDKIKFLEKSNNHNWNVVV
ncbi:MAG: branched-chain amino acid aminotransferase [Bacteroidia bacterium]|nr:branched-chain amino acid aminotransferase [Bacteroidia bacterium]NNJ55367.1 branched-chain amino acid aminotransferase [Bacteroidia bacterium]